MPQPLGLQELDETGRPPPEGPVPNVDQPFLMRLLPQLGHLAFTAAVMDLTNFSKRVSHSSQVYS